MKTIHLGHHFYGAGNIGDEFMLAGFFAALGPRADHHRFTSCIPYPLEGLIRRFPRVDWRPYDEATQRRSIEGCDLWLGLGGAPFQNAVSRWFIDHLASEAGWCAQARKPMFFLGVGGQDRAAYDLPELRAVAGQAEAIWTRDARTTESIGDVTKRPVRTGADLAHILFQARPLPAAKTGRLVAALNFEWADWSGLGKAVEAMGRVAAVERIWLAQEARPLPGAERVLFDQLPDTEKARWKLQPADIPGAPLPQVIGAWPSGEWVLSSRFHATLAAAWAGSRTLVIAANAKLSGAAEECGFPSIEPDAELSGLAERLQKAERADPLRMAGRAEAARRAISEFVIAAGM